MYPSSSRERRNFHSELLFPFCIKSEDVVNDLLLAVQNIIAGTIILSNRLISETCMECKIQLPSSSPIIKLQYEWQSDRVDSTHLIPVLEYGMSDENSEQTSDGTRSEHEIISDKIIESPFTMAKKLVSIDSLQENENEKIEMNICTEPTTDSFNNLDENVSSSSESDSIDSDGTRSHDEKFTWKHKLNNNFSRIMNNYSDNRQQKFTSLMEKTCNNSSNSVIEKVHDCQTDQVDFMHLIPILEYGESDEESGQNRDTPNNKRQKVCDKIIENPFTLAKQLVLDDPLQENGNKRNDVNIFTKATSSFVNNLDEHVSSSSESELLDSDSIRLPKEKLNWKCEDSTLNNDIDGIRTENAINEQEDTSQNHLCKYCKKSFMSEERKLVHEALHRGAKPFKCEECGKSFTAFRKFIRHKKDHARKRSYKCDQCSKCFFHQSKLIVHQRIHTGEKPFTCEYCDKAFAQLGNLIRHKRFHTEEKPFSCEYCDKAFTVSSSLKIHRRIHTGEKPYICEYCDKAFIQSSTLAKHKRTHLRKKPFKCDHCGISFSKPHYLSKHLKTHSEKAFTTCEQADQSFSEASNHFRRKQLQKEKPFKCEYCDKSYSQPHILYRHQIIHWRENGWKTIQSGKSFSEVRSSSKHKQIHKGKKPFTCEYCDKSFRKPRHLSSHRKTHAEEQHFTHMFTDKSYREASDLYRHKQIHKEEKRFKCDRCDKSFRKPHRLIQHQKTHSGEDTFTTCEQTGKSFNEANGLSCHKKMHKEKPFTCKHCRKSFSKQRHLSKHEKIHSEQKSLTDEHCNIFFTESSDLSRHECVDKEEKLYTCEHCDKSFTKPYGLSHSP